MGTVSGVVKDPQGLPAPGVTVSLLNRVSQAGQEAVTDTDGRYQLANIPFGIYVLTADDGKGNVAAATVNFVTQTSFAPPLVAVGVKADSGAYAVVKSTGKFVLNMLGKDGKGAAFTFFKPAKLEDGKLSRSISRQVEPVRIAPCWTLMIAFPQANQPTMSHLGPQWNAARSTHHRIAWMARESSKPGRDPIERWTVQASASWSAIGRALGDTAAEG